MLTNLKFLRAVSRLRNVQFIAVSRLDVMICVLAAAVRSTNIATGKMRNSSKLLRIIDEILSGGTIQQGGVPVSTWIRKGDLAE
ncbi:hypothetical protein D3C71_2047540 [compost metagenome]